MSHPLRPAVSAVGLASVERRALDEPFPCWLSFGPAEPIHEYQTDSSSKPPVSKAAFNQQWQRIEENLLTKVVPYQGAYHAPHNNRMHAGWCVIRTLRGSSLLDNVDLPVSGVLSSLR